MSVLKVIHITKVGLVFSLSNSFFNKTAQGRKLLTNLALVKIIFRKIELRNLIKVNPTIISKFSKIGRV